MDIKKFYEYAEKHGLTFEKITRGSSYFNNAPALIYDAARVDFSPFETCKINTVKTYCKNHGLTFDLQYHAGRGEFSAIIERAEDVDAIMIYYHYQNKCYDLCINYISKYRDVLTDAELNRLLNDTMNEYGAAYVNELITGDRKYLYA